MNVLTRRLLSQVTKKPFNNLYEFHAKRLAIKNHIQPWARSNVMVGRLVRFSSTTSSVSTNTVQENLSEENNEVYEPVLDPSLVIKPKKRLPQGFDVSKPSNYDSYKEEHLENLTVPSMDEFTELTNNYDYVKSNIGETISDITLRKLLHYHLYHGNAEEALLFYNDLVKNGWPYVYEYDMMFCVLGEAGKFEEIGRLYKEFRESQGKPTVTTFNILFKALGDSGHIEPILELYETSFEYRNIPTIENIFQIVKCAAVAGEPKFFNRFFERIGYKGYRVPKHFLQHFSDIWGTNKSSSDYGKKIFLNTYDFSRAMEIILRTRNYRSAIDLIYECRDVYDMQPDAMMYETLLAACMRDGIFSERARVWKKKFHKYPKGIEVREEHFQFGEFIKEIEEFLGKNIRKAIPFNGGLHYRLKKTPRRESKKLYKFYPNVRYTSRYEGLDKFDWVPEYVERKRIVERAIEEKDNSDLLAEIESEARKEQEELSKEFGLSS